MKTTMWPCAWVSAALCLSGCGRDDGGEYPSAAVAVQVAPAAYAVPYAMAASDVMGYRLEVVVQSNSGFPLAGAWVQVVANECTGNGAQQANTDEWGRAYFYFCVQPGSWVYIDAGSMGFAPAAVDLATGGDPCPAVPIYLAPMGG